MKDTYFDMDTRAILNLLPFAPLPEAAEGWTISRVSVLPQDRGQGIASMLMHQVLRDADVESVILYLEVQPDASRLGLNFQELYNWYSRCGFRPAHDKFPVMVRYPKESNAQEV